jgi:hypothetical protein
MRGRGEGSLRLNDRCDALGVNRCTSDFSPERFRPNAQLRSESGLLLPIGGFLQFEEIAFAVAVVPFAGFGEAGFGELAGEVALAGG